METLVLETRMDNWIQLVLLTNYDKSCSKMILLSKTTPKRSMNVYLGLIQHWNSNFSFQTSQRPNSPLSPTNASRSFGPMDVVVTLVKLPRMLSKEGIPDTTILGDLDEADAISLPISQLAAPQKKSTVIRQEYKIGEFFFGGGLFWESIRAHFCT